MDTTILDEFGLIDIIQRNWWIILVRGLIALALSIFAFFQPAQTIVVLLKVLGIYLIIDGFLMMIAAVSGRQAERRWWVVLLRSLVAILGGIAIFALPVFIAQVSVSILVLLIGIAFILVGLSDIVTAIRVRREIKNEWAIILGGFLSTIFGILVLASPMMFGLLLVQLIAILAGIAGFLMILLALQLRKPQPPPNQGAPA